MCGIAGIHRRGNKPIPKLNQLSDELLLAIESRGKDATGYLAMMDDGKVQLQKVTMPASRFVKERGRLRANARNVLLHTRFATVGRATDPRNAHPVAQGSIAATHNGTIYNATALFHEYKLERPNEVDSQVVPALIDHFGWDAVEKVLAKLHGGAALAIVNADKPDEVVLARVRSYPLHYAVTEHAVIWASTPDAIKRAWYRTYGRDLRAKVRTMEEGRWARVNGKVIEQPISGWERTGWPVTPKAPVPKRPARSKGRVSDATYLKAARRSVRQVTPPSNARPNYGLGYPIKPQGYVVDDRGSIIPEAYLTDAERAELQDDGLSAWAEEIIEDLMADGMSRAEAEATLYGSEDERDWQMPAFLDGPQR